MKRRNFIKATGLGTLGMGLLQSASTPFASLGYSKDQINIGIIGTGDRGAGLIPYISEIDGLHLTACCDILPFRLKTAEKLATNPFTSYSDYRELLDSDLVDAVIIATPFYLHEEMALEALDSGKHVYCEKTLVKGYKGISRLLNKCGESSKIFQTGHQYHSSRLYTHAVNWIQEGNLGTIAAIQCQWNRHGDWRRPVPREDLERIINWRMYREFSGGLVAELCSHQLDFTNWVLGSNPLNAMGVGGVDYWKDGRETYDNVHLIYTYPDGVKAKFTCLTSNAKDDYRIEVLGDKGTLALSYDKAWFYPESGTETEKDIVDGVSGATASWNPQEAYELRIEHSDPSKQALMDFRDAIYSGEQPASNAITGARAAACVQMGLDAMIKNKIVSWNKNLPV